MLYKLKTEEGLITISFPSNQADNLGVVLLSLREVSIYSPDNRILVNKLTMDTSVDCNTIIMGPSGELSLTLLEIS